ncbi:MAG: heme-binding domain-containing protein [Bacteroidales bacterium]|nr:heme-binding domain-containing protein [Bacteroidales bacterium]
MKIFGTGLIVLLVVLQFFRPELNQKAFEPEKDLLSVVSAPENIATLLRNACYDCHSNQTAYPWYQKISPVSWYLNGHINRGKADLNFSEYGTMGKADRIGLLVKTCEVVEAGSMPLPSYQILHREARLKKKDLDILCNWTEEEALKVMRE